MTLESWVSKNPVDKENSCDYNGNKVSNQCYHWR